MSRALWFFEPLPPSRFVIQEHLRQNLWRAGLATAWFEATQATHPYQVEGRWGELPFTIRWEPASWMTLQLVGDSEPVVSAFTLALGFPPFARYQADGHTVYEWRATGRAARTTALKADAAVQGLTLLLH